jgi:hypothetical protein
MKSFAGFWRDGAVVQPENKHWSNCRCVFTIQKDDNSLDICLRNFNKWETVYWLDTTTPTELTPQEAFECLKMLFPMITQIEKDRKRDYTVKGDGYTEANINWGDLTEYPPRKSWRVPTDADKGKKCRCWDIGEPVLEGVFVSTHDDRFVVLIDDEYLAWDCCEVQDEN